MQILNSGVAVPLISHALASGLFFYALLSKNTNKSTTTPIAIGFFNFGTIILALALITLYTLYKPVLNSSYNGFILALVISFLTIIGHYKFKMPLLGTFTAPITTIILLFQLTNLHPPLSYEKATTPLQLFHIGVSLLGEGFIILSFAIATWILFIQRVLKAKKVNMIPNNCPSVDQMDRALMIPLWCGFILITLGVSSGALVHTTSKNPIQPGIINPKIFWALLVWFWYFAIIIARKVFHYPKRRIAQMCFFGFALLSASFFGLIWWGK